MPSAHSLTVLTALDRQSAFAEALGFPARPDPGVIVSQTFFKSSLILLHFALYAFAHSLESALAFSKILLHSDTSLKEGLAPKHRLYK